MLELAESRLDGRREGKKDGRGGKSLLIAKYRWLVGVLATFLSNIHIANFAKGSLYRGKAKSVCVPGLNCYSCPAATGACPIGAFQAVVGSADFGFSYYITGIAIFVGVMLGRVVCGFLCPFGWFQELLYKIPSRKISTKKVGWLTYVKYFVLAVFVVLLPMIVMDEVGLSNPFFCKYICPAGILEGAIPLALADSSIRAALGLLFSWKLAVLALVVLGSVMVYRPFCKWLCPLGAFYSLFNSIAFVSLTIDRNKCISCGKCNRVCKMDVNVMEHENDRECIRCGHCIKACPTNAISFACPFSHRNSEMKKKYSEELK